MRSGGVVREFHEMNLHDVIDNKYIADRIPQKVARNYINPDPIGRARLPVAQKLGAFIFRTFMKILIDNLMEKNRLVIRRKYAMYIGKLRMKPYKLVTKHKRHNHHFHTDGKWYGVVLDGMDHNYSFRMPRRRRQELYDRIMNGEQFYG